jgi:hypothetical protein
VAGSAYYFGFGTPRGSGTPNTHLDLVPADTLMFAGGLEPVPVRKILEHTGLDYAQWFTQDDLNQIYQALDLHDAADGVRLLGELLVFYFNHLDDPAELLGKLGLADEFNVTLYTVGLVPVMRMQIADRSAFDQTFAGIEHNARVAPLIRDLGGVEHKVYPLIKGADNPSLVVVETGDDVAIIVDLGDPEALATAIGATKPETSMAKTDEIKRLNQKYDYSAFGTFLLNHRAIVAALTSAENQAGRTIARLLADDVRADDIKLLRNRTCANEFNSIARIWPRTVAGYREIAITDDGFVSEFHSVIEIEDPELLEILRRVRGYIPRSLIDSEDTEFAFALGLDVAKLGRVAGELVRYMKQWNYECPALVPLNQWGKNAASASMTASVGAAMGQGIKGVSIGLLDLAIDGAGDDFKLNKLDAVLAVSAEDPKLLLENAGAIPGLGQIDVPEDGTPVDAWLPIPLTGGHLRLPLKLALSGDHLTAFSGAKAGRLARAFARDNLEANGLMYYKFDYRSYFDTVVNALRSRHDRRYRPEDMQMLEALQSFDAVYQGHLDITERGIELTGDIIVRD